MSDFQIDNKGCLTKYTGNGGDVVIPEGVTSIGKEAFEFCGSLTSVTIPEGVTSIGDNAFYCCLSLKSVYAQSLRLWLTMKFGRWGNPCCNGAALYIEGELVTSVTISSGVKRIADDAFHGCISLTNITIPEGVISIGDDAFKGCSGLTSVAIPEGVTRIGHWAFERCSSLKSVTIPGSVKEIELGAFEDCTSLNSVIIRDGVTGICATAFRGCNRLTSIAIPEGVKSIGESAFKGCSSLTSVTIAEGVTSIGKEAFKDCSSLTSVTIPEGVTSIGERAFEYCRSLTSVTIPDSVTSISCSTLPKQLITFNTDQLCIINHVLFGCSADAVSVDVPNCVRVIAAGAFSGCGSLSSITIPNSVTAVGDMAFCRCQNLKTVIIPESVVDFPVSAVGDSIQTLDIRGSACGELRKAMMENGAYLLGEKAIASLWADGKKNRNLLAGKFRDKAVKVFGYILDILREDKKKAEAAAGFMERVGGITAEQAREAVELLKKYKYKGLDQLLQNAVIQELLSEGKNEEHPIEAYVRERIAATELNPKALKRIDKGIRYANRNACSSPDVVAYIVTAYYAEYLRCKTEVQGVMGGYDCLTNGMWLNALPEPDKVAQALDRAELIAFLEKSLKHPEYRVFLVAWARFADDESVARVTATYKTMIGGKAKDRIFAEQVREALMINDTVAAMKFMDRIGYLDLYAKKRGTSVMVLRDTAMLPVFGFNRDGIVRYDIGGNIIEVSITQDMGLRLFDAKAGKELRSFPKKSDDPEKADACAKEFAALKKEVLAFAKERTGLLRKMHLSGEAVELELWQKIYAEHPVIRNLTRLLVWQDEAKRSFVVTGKGILDPQGMAYAPVGKIHMAHVLNLSEAEIDAWQRWFVREKLKQPFEQIWEPVIKWRKGGISKRYDGAELTKEERAALKKALAMRGIEVRSGWMEREYNPYFGGLEFSHENNMLFGDSFILHYRVDEETGSITFGDVIHCGKPGSREMNAVLLELDKATVSHQVTRDNDEVLTDETLSVFSAAQIADLLKRAIDSGAARCTARLLDYKNAHYPEFAAVDEFSLDW